MLRYPNERNDPGIDAMLQGYQAIPSARTFGAPEAEEAWLLRLYLVRKPFYRAAR